MLKARLKQCVFQSSPKGCSLWNYSLEVTQTVDCVVVHGSSRCLLLSRWNLAFICKNVVLIPRCLFLYRLFSAFYCKCAPCATCVVWAPRPSVRQSVSLSDQGCIWRGVRGFDPPQQVADPPESSAEPLWGVDSNDPKNPPPWFHFRAKPVYLCTTIRRLRLYRDRRDLI